MQFIHNVTAVKSLFLTTLLFSVFLLLVPFVSTDAKNETFVLVLDPGHGGKDPGAIGKKGKEKHINLKITKLAGEYIRQKHPEVKIIYTRTGDTFIGLHERADMANRNKANLFISIHTNSVNNKSVKGPEVFTFGISKTKENFNVAKKENSVIYLEDNYEEKYEGFNQNMAESFIMFEFMQNVYTEQSINFASLVQDELKSCVQWRDRGVKQAEYLVLWKATMPRILIELDFISNADAENFLLSEKGQKRYAKAICDAFSKYKAEYDRKNTGNKTLQVQNTKPANKTENKPSDIKNTKKVYKVQILSSSKKIPDNSRQLKGYKADYYTENNLYKYTYGESGDFIEISKIRKSLLKDFKDAFVVCFENGIRVSIN